VCGILSAAFSSLLFSSLLFSLFSSLLSSLLSPLSSLLSSLRLHGDACPGEGSRHLPCESREPVLTLPAGLQQALGAFLSLRHLQGWFGALRTKPASGASLRYRFGALWKAAIRFSSAEPPAQQMGHAGAIFLLDKQLAKITTQRTNYAGLSLCNK